MEKKHPNFFVVSFFCRSFEYMIALSKDEATGIGESCFIMKGQKCLFHFDYKTR